MHREGRSWTDIMRSLDYGAKSSARWAAKRAEQREQKAAEATAAVKGAPAPPPMTTLELEQQTELRDSGTAYLKAVVLRTRGKSYAQIAQILNLPNAKTAEEIVRAVITDIPKPSKDEIKAIDTLRLDQLYKVSFGQAVSGDPKAVANCLAIIERRAKVFGTEPQGEQRGIPGGSTFHTLVLNLSQMPTDQLKAIVSGQMKDLENVIGSGAPRAPGD
jgi:hypothetical protein